MSGSATLSRPKIRIRDRGDGLFGWLRGIKCGDGGRISTNYTSASCCHDTLCVHCTLSHGVRHKGCRIEACRAATDARKEYKCRRAEEVRLKRTAGRLSARLARAANVHMRKAHRIHGGYSALDFSWTAELVATGFEDRDEWYETVHFCPLCGHIFNGDPRVTPPEPRVVWLGSLTLQAAPDIFFEREKCDVCRKAMRVRKRRWHYSALGPDYEYKGGGHSNRDYNVHEECGKTLPTIPPPGTKQDYPYSGYCKAKPGEKDRGWKDGTVLASMILRNGIWVGK